MGYAPLALAYTQTALAHRIRDISLPPIKMLRKKSLFWHLSDAGENAF
jgi:hypothetical protein